MKVTIFLVIISILTGCAQRNKDRYYEESSGQYVSNDDGQYIHDDSGRYIPDYSGLYRDDGTGRYKHIVDKYRDTYKDQATSIKAQIVKPLPVFQPILIPVPKREIKYGKYDDSRSKIIRLASNVDRDGFQWEYETENEIVGEEQARILNKGSSDEAIATKGFYRYTGPDNVIYNVEYTADEKGFIPKADHLPLALQKALAHYAKGE